MPFKAATFPSARKILRTDVTTARRKSTPTRITIRISGKTLKALAVNPKGDRKVSPFLDLETGEILLVFGDRGATKDAKNFYESNNTILLEFPFTDDFAEMFAKDFVTLPAKVIEAAPGRLVFQPGRSAE